MKKWIPPIALREVVVKWGCFKLGVMHGKGASRWSMWQLEWGTPSRDPLGVLGHPPCTPGGPSRSNLPKELG